MLKNAVPLKMSRKEGMPAFVITNYQIWKSLVNVATCKPIKIFYVQTE